MPIQKPPFWFSAQLPDTPESAPVREAIRYLTDGRPRRQYRKSGGARRPSGRGSRKQSRPAPRTSAPNEREEARQRNTGKKVMGGPNPNPFGYQPVQAQEGHFVGSVFVPNMPTAPYGAETSAGPLAGMTTEEAALAMEVERLKSLAMAEQATPVLDKKAKESKLKASISGSEKETRVNQPETQDKKKASDEMLTDLEMRIAQMKAQYGL